MKGRSLAGLFKTQNSLIKETADLHFALRNFEIPACEIPEKLAKLECAYIKVMEHDCVQMRKQMRSSACENQLNKQAVLSFIQRTLSFKQTLSEDERKRLQELQEIPEAQHLQSYLSLQEEKAQYGTVLREYLANLKAELRRHEFSPHEYDVAVHHVGAPSRHTLKGKTVSEAAQDLRSELANFDETHASMLKLYKKYASVVKIMKAGSESSQLNKFYQQQLQVIEKFSFISASEAKSASLKH